MKPWLHHVLEQSATLPVDTNMTLIDAMDGHSTQSNTQTTQSNKSLCKHRVQTRDGEDGGARGRVPPAR